MSLRAELAGAACLLNAPDTTAVMRVFLEAPLQPVPLDQAAARAGLPPADALRAIQKLNQTGVSIQMYRSMGFYYDPEGGSMHPDLLAAMLGTRWWGRRIAYAEEAPSTIPLAKALAAAGDPHGAVAVCGRQTEGRGRGGNAWVSPAGKDILLTFVIRRGAWTPPPSLLSLYIAVGAARALDTAHGLPVRIKWPNDLVLHGKKAGGALAEDDPAAGCLVASLGLNVSSGPGDWPSEIRDSAISLSMASAAEFSRTELTAQLGISWETQWEIMTRDGGASVRDDWNRYSCSLGRAASVIHRGSELRGFAKGIGGDGRLVFIAEHGETRLLAPEEVREFRVLE